MKIAFLLPGCKGFGKLLLVYDDNRPFPSDGKVRRVLVFPGTTNRQAPSRPMMALLLPRVERPKI